ncbi:TPA: BC_2427 family protein [Bacillus cereus]
MKKPWISNEIWNKINKEKVMNSKDDSREIREKEEIAIGLRKERKERKETELVKEKIEVELEREEIKMELGEENEENGSKKEEVAMELKKESGKTERIKEEKTIKLEGKEGKVELKKKSIDSGAKIETSVRSIVVKTPFSIISDVTSFIKFPNINVKNQETFVFRNEENAGGRELEAKLFTTVQSYYGEVSCNLVASNLHEKRTLLELTNRKVVDSTGENQVGTSSWIPIHGVILEKEDEGEVNNYINARLPVEIGKYKGEVHLREQVVFNEKVIEIKEISQEIILTKKEFFLPKIMKKGNNPSKIEKGRLLVEGYISQCIECILERNPFHDQTSQLMQNIVLELTIQLLQEQEVRVRIT